jgi:hypothetical protein
MVAEELPNVGCVEEMVDPLICDHREHRDHVTMRYYQDSSHHAEARKQLAELLDSLEEQVVKCVALLVRGVFVADLVFPFQVQQADTLFFHRHVLKVILDLRFLAPFETVGLVLDDFIVVLCH